MTLWVADSCLALRRGRCGRCLRLILELWLLMFDVHSKCQCVPCHCDFRWSIAAAYIHWLASEINVTVMGYPRPDGVVDLLLDC